MSLFEQLKSGAGLISLGLPLVIGLLLKIIPPLNDWWNSNVSIRWKPTVLFGLCEVLSVGSQLGACLGVDFGLGATCLYPNLAQTWVNAVMIGGFAFVIQQGGYLVLIKPVGDRMEESIANKGNDSQNTLLGSLVDDLRSLVTKQSEQNAAKITDSLVFDAKTLPYELMTDEELLTLVQLVTSEVRKRSLPMIPPPAGNG